MSNIFDVGDEVATLDHRRTGFVVDTITDRTVMVQWDDEAFCRLLHTDTLIRPDYVTLVRNPKQRKTLLGSAAWIVGMALLVTSVMWMASNSAKAEPVTRSGAPYGGCKEVVQDPPRMTHTEGAAWCREHGWTIQPRLVVGPHGTVRYHRLPSCTYEDGSGSPLPCSWNIRSGDGNGIGLAYWIGVHHHTHWVWAHSPVSGHPHRQWVDSGLADALAEGFDGPTVRHQWEHCYFQVGATSTVRCPSGFRVAS